MEEPWMMPTYDQCEELINNTTYEYTTENGVNCGKFINKIDSSKYIFLSPGGYWTTALDSGQSLYQYYGSQGYYHSTTWYSSTYSYSMSFYSSEAHTSHYLGRSSGSLIRAVRKLKR